MPRRTIQSPGIEIREIDLTTRSGGPIGTSIFIAGFANQGPVDEIFDIGTFSNFETIYGKPTNSAERYFYHTVRQAFNSDANIFVSRIPYEDTTENEKYSALFYPVESGVNGNYKFSLSVPNAEINNPTAGNTEIIVKDIWDLLPLTDNSADRTPSNLAGYLNIKLEIDNIKGDTYEFIDIVSGLPNGFTIIADSGEIIKNGVMRGDPRDQYGVGDITGTLGTQAEEQMEGDGEDGNIVINSNTKHLWYKDGSTWVDKGKIPNVGEIRSLKLRTSTGSPDPGAESDQTVIIINVDDEDREIYYRSGKNERLVTTTGIVELAGTHGVSVNNVKKVNNNDLEIILAGISTNDQESFINLLKSVDNHEYATGSNRILNISPKAEYDQPEHHQGRAIVTTTEDPEGNIKPYSQTNQYIIQNPIFKELTKEQYNKISENCIEWSIAPGGEVFGYDANSGNVTINAGLVIVNKGQTTINNNFEGYYVGLIDNTQANPNTDYDAVTAQYSVKTDNTGFDDDPIPTTRLDYVLTSSNREESQSISRTLTEIPTFDIQDDDYHDTISIGVFKVRTSPFNNSDINLSFFLAEGYTGSFDQDRKVQNDQGGGNRSFFLEEQPIQSPNIKVLVNDNIQNQFEKVTDPNDPTGEVPNKTVKVAADKLYALGLYSSPKKTKYITNLPNKLSRIFELASNVDQFNIDISLEAGLGTIWANAKENEQTKGAGDYVFDETKFLNLGFPGNNTTGVIGDGLFTPNPRPIKEFDQKPAPSETILDHYKTIYNRFEQFARQGRKDHIFVADILRNIVVQGERKVLNDKSKNFSQHIYWAIRHQFRFANSNYVATYANWAKVYDGASDKQVWIPFSGIMGAIYANTDSNFAPWFAPAGFTRGIVRGINDIAMVQSQYQRDQLYKIGINPVTHFPNEGIIVFGQKTLQRRPSAFDRVNVRRLFLNLEKRTRAILKYFIFEPNTFLTRSKVVNTLNPIFENAKQTQGVYDYLVVCDNRNNTAEVIQNNEMVIDIYLKPVRAAEFILVNFYAVNNDVNFEELIQ